MVQALGYVEGLRRLGIEAAFVPSDELDEGEWDLIHLLHAQYPWSRDVAERTKKPLVVSAITQHSPSVGEVAPATERASAVLCYTVLEEDWYATRFPHLPRERFRSAPLGVASDIYAPHQDAAASPSVFVAGRYPPVKNQLLVLRACKALDVPVTFAGMVDDGAYLRDVREEAGNWRGVRLLGMLKGEALYRRYRAAHVHCQPSAWEAFGLCTWEAMASGCNVVVTNNGWGGPLFEPHGTVCEPALGALTAAIRRELQAVRDRHGFRPPTWDQAARALVPVYQEALAREGVAA